jgi:hypothetical protein
LARAGFFVFEPRQPKSICARNGWAQSHRFIR